MMKKIVFLLFLCGLVLSTSCTDSQQVSQRVNAFIQEGDSLSEQATKVPFKRLANNLAEVQVSLNGVPCNMWWDTGASVTCISLLELKRLAKEGKVQLEDYAGNSVATIADGSKVENALFRIKELYIQGRDNKNLILHDVVVSVSANEHAPLLLGQNVINSLPKHSFNETEEVIEFE